jgi:HD-like signal output (HDOD) protein
MQTPHIDSEQQLIDNLLKSGIVIPPQPAVLIEMEQLLGKPNTKISTIAKLVPKMPAYRQWFSKSLVHPPTAWVNR